MTTHAPTDPDYCPGMRELPGTDDILLCELEDGHTGACLFIAVKPDEPEERT
jgi:hypothetical protein